MYVRVCPYARPGRLLRGALAGVRTGVLLSSSLLADSLCFLACFNRFSISIFLVMYL